MVAIKHKKTKTKSNDFTIILIFTAFKKKLSKEYKILGPREINSGVCIFNTRKLVIFRKEENEKLLIHELSHLLELDLHKVDINNISSYVNINPNIELRINESVTEILALLIHSIVVSINLSTKKNYRLACTMINYEINFNLIQISKILIHFGFNNCSEFFRSYDDKNIFQQTTSVFSYFIVKTLCLYNKNSLHIFLNNNFDNFNYNDKEKCIIAFKQLVIESLTKSDFHKQIDKLINIIKTNIKNKMFLETLRMTCIEMN